MTRFYAMLLAVVLTGGGAIAWMMRSPKAESVAVAEPAATATDITPHNGYAIGIDSAPVEIVEYADFQCGACMRFAVLQEPDVKQRLVNTGRVRWVFRDFPLDIHDKALMAHHAAACAGEQSKFWEMHDQLYFQHGAWAEIGGSSPARKFKEFARAAGLNVDQYDQCMDSDRHAARIKASVARGAKMGVSSTPTFVIGGRLYPGVLTYDQLKTIVDSISPPSKQ